MKKTMKTILSLGLALCLNPVLIPAQAAEGEPEKETVVSGVTELSAPVIEEDPSMPGNRKTTWQCVCFGAYPTSEVVEKDFSAVEAYAVDPGDVIADAALYETLASAEWEDNETEIEGVRYRRMQAADAESWSDSRAQHYVWDSEETWHYFRYEPIRWRVLDVREGVATLVADRQPDCAAYNDSAEAVCWENCTLRSFLNGYGGDENLDGVSFDGKEQDSFYGTAFSEEEKQCILTSEVKNPDNYYFGTPCGPDTQDKVYIFHEQEVFLTEEAMGYGFAKSDGTDDAARRFRPTLYALARGAWYSPVETNEGNGFWLLRTSGYTPANVNYVCDFGAVYNRGTLVNVRDAGILPVIRVDASKAVLADAGRVSSEEVIRKAQEKPALELYEPVVEEDESLSSGLRTTWKCVWFGEYPESEIVEKEAGTVEDYAVDPGDVIVDPRLYGELCEAGWTDDETELDGRRYRRLKAEETAGQGEEDAQHYRWEDEDTWHYFRYEPIRWRVLELDGDEALLLSDRELDSAPYHTESEDVQWADCTLRSFLNGYDAAENAAGISFDEEAQDSFFNTAFSEEEKKSILCDPVENPDNSYYETDCGPATEDPVFILSSEEVFSGENAGRHGFYPGGGVDDPARHFRPTMYAKARGTWYSPVEGYEGNGFWFMRTNGYTLSNVTYICDFGYIYNRGTDVTCSDSGILPAIRVDLSTAELQDAGEAVSGS